MELTHRHGWRFFEVSAVDGNACLRLCLDRRWIGDYRPEHLGLQLAAFGVPLADFAPTPDEPCHVVDPSSRLTCPRRAEHTAAPPTGRFRLCDPCAESLQQMRAAPNPSVGAPTTPTGPRPPGLDCLLHALGDEEDHRWLSGQLRQPIAKILGYAELLDDDRDALGTEHGQMVGVIHQSARQLQQVLADIAWAL